MSLTIVLTNGITSNVFIVKDGSEYSLINVTSADPGEYKTNSSSIIFTFNQPPPFEMYTAFQGYKIYEKFYGKNSCDLVQTAQPLFLDDETEIIYIHAPEKSLKNINCSWTFTAPKDYGFKFTAFTHILNATIIVKNSSDYIITDIYTKINVPYYNVDHNITVILNASSISPVFNAFITIVKKDFNRTFFNCTEEYKGGYMEWSNSYYPNNAYCDLPTPIKSNHQLFVAPFAGVDAFENLADPVTIEIDGDENNIIIFTHDGQGDEDNGYSIPFGPYENGTTKTLLWNFESDGSISTQGFGFDFIFYECYCNNLIITVPCQNQYNYYLIDTSNISGDKYKNWYCANMNCTFTILIDENCPDKYIFAQMGIVYGPYRNSSFKLISNNETMIDLCKTTLK